MDSPRRRKSVAIAGNLGSRRAATSAVRISLLCGQESCFHNLGCWSDQHPRLWKHDSWPQSSEIRTAEVAALLDPRLPAIATDFLRLGESMWHPKRRGQISHTFFPEPTKCDG